MIECGIIDPCKVVATCIEDAVSIAGLILSTECILVREKQFKLDKTLSDKFNQG
jgi:chaperonin GroEL (HSP60 family)